MGAILLPGGCCCPEACEECAPGETPTIWEATVSGVNWCTDCRDRPDPSYRDKKITVVPSVSPNRIWTLYTNALYAAGEPCTWISTILPTTGTVTRYDSTDGSCVGIYDTIDFYCVRADLTFSSMLADGLFTITYYGELVYISGYAFFREFAGDVCDESVQPNDLTACGDPPPDHVVGNWWAAGGSVSLVKAGRLC